MALDGKSGLTLLGVEGDIPKALKAAAYKKLAESMGTAEFASQFHFRDSGILSA